VIEGTAQIPMLSADVDKISFEKISGLSKLIKTFLVNPMINHVLPVGLMKFFLTRSASPLLRECLLKPGGWMSMEHSYDNQKDCKDWLDFLVMCWGAMPMALRNRKKLVSRVLANLIKEYADKGHVKVLGIGAGPSRNLLAAVMLAGEKDVSATCIDRDGEAFAFGKRIWKESGIPEDAITFLEGDAADLTRKIHIVPQIVKLVGILEYLPDDALDTLLHACGECLEEGGSLITHSIYPDHGVDPFLRRVFNLHLHYRPTELLIQKLSHEGFCDFDTFREPIGVYKVIVARKKSHAISQ
jgi:SAM-dependent methyltransferase